uniref:Uncharacterized protein n=1 Tax=Graphocephala atropunctata TaxID=36148 RepID=A0A1B6KD08_9HEMI
MQYWMFTLLALILGHHGEGRMTVPSHPMDGVQVKLKNLEETMKQKTLHTRDLQCKRLIKAVGTDVHVMSEKVAQCKITRDPDRLLSCEKALPLLPVVVERYRETVQLACK